MRKLLLVLVSIMLLSCTEEEQNEFLNTLQQTEPVAEQPENTENTTTQNITDNNEIEQQENTVNNSYQLARESYTYDDAVSYYADLLNQYDFNEVKYNMILNRKLKIKNNTDVDLYFCLITAFDNFMSWVHRGCPPRGWHDTDVEEKRFFKVGANDEEFLIVGDYNWVYISNLKFMGLEEFFPLRNSETCMKDCLTILCRESEGFFEFNENSIKTDEYYIELPEGYIPKND